ncbi:BTAD domain-containing putative transcriptional regulator [Streptomyces sp. CA-249302]|uniref:AfsR/SARP family transcriptional regulator n=1 Tax=Streptomyces sp. CA-249302 TaxID=3240058 RepID=UPI003D9374B7
MTSMPWRFTVLGELRVWRDGAEVDPGPPLRRTLLALLLARAGSPVPLPDIVDALWADRPPARAVNMVHRHVGELRRLLEPELPNRAEGSLLLRGGGGYRLLAPSGSVDLLVFRELATTARELLRSDASEQAVSVFAEALALRHGSAAGCPSAAPPHPVFSDLDREYDAMVREAADAALRHGHADRVLPALSESAARHPLDEGLQALHIRTLAATGRRAEAREVFRATAARLTDELGVDPGAELNAARLWVTSGPGTARGGDPHTDRALAHHTGAADLDTPLPATPSVPPVRPAQLPPALTVFAGRTAELDRLRNLLDGAGHRTPALAIAAIGGPPGVGKTAFAVRLAHEVADRFPDGQLHVDLRGFGPAGRPTPPQDVLRGFLDALGAPPARIPDGLDARAALYRSLSAGRRLLVLLDNARDAAQVRPLLPGAPGCLVLVTSRNRLGGLASAEGAHPVTLDVLGPAEARSALALRLGAERVAAEPRAVAEIVSLTAGLPLALAVVAARAADRPAFALATPAEQLRAADGGLDAFRAADPASDVRAVFSWSYDALGGPAARMFRLLSRHPGPELTVRTAAALAGEPAARVRVLLTELADAHLLTERSPGRYACHDLLRAYAAELVRGRLTSQAHFVHCPLPTLPPPAGSRRLP